MFGMHTMLQAIPIFLAFSRGGVTSRETEAARLSRGRCWSNVSPIESWRFRSKCSETRQKSTNKHPVVYPLALSQNDYIEVPLADKVITCCTLTRAFGSRLLFWPRFLCCERDISRGRKEFPPEHHYHDRTWVLVHVFENHVAWTAGKQRYYYLSWLLSSGKDKRSPEGGVLPSWKTASCLVRA